MGSPFKMMPGSKSGNSRDTGLIQMEQRGLIGGPKSHDGTSTPHAKSESLSKEAPSRTEYSREVKNKPGSVTTTKSKSSGGKKTTAAYDAAIKAEGTRILPKGQKSTKAMTDKYNANRAKAKLEDKANSSSSSGSSKTVVTKPSRTVKESSKQISKGKSAYDIQKDAETKNKTAASRRVQNQKLAVNKASGDSIRDADNYRKSQAKLKGDRAYSDKNTTTKAVQIGNKSAQNSLKAAGTHTKGEIESLFSSDYGNRKGTVSEEGYASKNKFTGDKTKRKGGSSVSSMRQGNNTVPGSKEDVGVVKKGNKKGSMSFGKANPNTGLRGSRG